MGGKNNKTRWGGTAPSAKDPTNAKGTGEKQNGPKTRPIAQLQGKANGKPRNKETVADMTLTGPPADRGCTLPKRGAGVRHPWESQGSHKSDKNTSSG